MARAERRRHPRRRKLLLLIIMLAVVAGIVAATVVLRSRQQPLAGRLALRQVSELTLPVDSSRFDYASLDAERGLLFVAHLGASEVIEIDVRAHRVVRVIPHVSQVHGVLVVPHLHRVYATATGDNTMVTFDEDTGAVLTTSPTGNYPDGLALDPRRNAVWTTNETGGSETVIDALTGAVRGTVELGADAGNVAYDAAADQMIVDVQGHNELAVIDPATLTISRRMPLPGCQNDHGLAIDSTHRLAFVACDVNATLLTIDLATWQVTGTTSVGEAPDVLAYDEPAHRLYVATESGTVTILDQHDEIVTLVSSGHLADDAHVVAVDLTTHHSYYPIPHGENGKAALLDEQ